MAIKNGDKKSKLIIGVSSRALFDLEKEDTIFKSEGLDKYIEYQRSHENEPLKPGKAFPLIKAFTDLKVRDSEDNLAKIIIMSRNSADTGLRIFNSIEHYKLDIKQGAFVSGGDITKYLNSFNIDLFLSADEDVVKKATKCNVASGLLKYSEQEESIDLNEEIKQIKIAFDADSVIFFK